MEIEPQWPRGLTHRSSQGTKVVPTLARVTGSSRGLG